MGNETSLMLSGKYSVNELLKGDMIVETDVIQ